MTDVEIVLKTQILGSAFAEYIEYFQPIYEKRIVDQTVKMNRQNRKAFTKSEMKDFYQLKLIANRFSKIMENNMPDKHDEGIDLIHNALESIKISEN